MEVVPYKRRINYYETDRMNIVHHSNYPRYLEEARLDYMRQVGIAYDELERKGIIIPVLELHHYYTRSIGFGDIIEVHIKLTKLTAARFRMKYEIYNVETGELERVTDYEERKKEKAEKKEKRQREKNVQKAVIELTQKFGKNAVLKGMNLEEGATTVERNRQIGGHKAE